MQRKEEKIGASSSKFASKIQHQTGNVNVFVLGTAMVIAALWLVFQHDAAGTPTIEAAATTSAASVHQSQYRFAASNGNNMAEVVVTAPRLTEESESFEQPAKEIALVEPKAPKTFWQTPS